jgi:pSer/pThr/pTyr-binding forkhead associated (FHA) protein
MGRGHQCEIRLQDISVSRQHSEIKLVGNEFYISDCNSKFGTLVKLDKVIELSSKIKLQIGRSVYSFNIE